MHAGRRVHESNVCGAASVCMRAGRRVHESNVCGAASVRMRAGRQVHDVCGAQRVQVAQTGQVSKWDLHLLAVSTCEVVFLSLYPSSSSAKTSRLPTTHAEE